VKIIGAADHQANTGRIVTANCEPKKKECNANSFVCVCVCVKFYMENVMCDIKIA